MYLLKHPVHFDEVQSMTVLSLSIGKDKEILLKAWTGPEGPRTLRLPDFKTFGT